MQVWGARCDAFDAGDEAAGFLSEWLGRPLRLVRFDPRRSRLSNQDWTAGREVPTLFTDGYPLLVLSRASIEDLAARVGHALPVERFRPNLLLDGVAAYAEDDASRAENRRGGAGADQGLHPLRDHHHRPGTGARHEGEEPLRTLKRYRYDREIARGRVRRAMPMQSTGVGADSGARPGTVPAIANC